MRGNHRRPVNSPHKWPVTRKMFPFDDVIMHDLDHFATLNSPRPNNAYVRQQTRPSLFKIMACRLFGTNPLSEPILSYCQLDPCKQISVKFELKFQQFSFRKINIEMSAKWGQLCLGPNVLTSEKVPVIRCHYSNLEWRCHDFKISPYTLQATDGNIMWQIEGKYFVNVSSYGIDDWSCTISLL